jgi:hypothetical protein
MNIEKLDPNCFYYTDLISDEEAEFVLSELKKDENWERIYNKGIDYNPKRDPFVKENQSLMVAYRKEFSERTNPKVHSIILKAFKLAGDHYSQEKGLQDKRQFREFSHINKHSPGTVYGTHIDTAPVDLESYSILFYLNDDYTGGEISFSLPTPDKKIAVLNGNLAEGPNGLFHPRHENNKDLITFWLKPKAFSIIIFPPLRPHIYPHTAHEVTNGDKYLIKGHWQVDPD